MHKKLLTRAALLGLLTMLAGCATDGQGIGSSIQTPSTETAKQQPATAACIAIAPISPSRGKPGGATTEDIAAALDRDHPIERVRNLVGDTSGTLKQVDQNNAARSALCGK